LVGADMAQRTPGQVDFSMQWVGRPNCVGTPQGGPDRILPAAHITTAGLFHFFSAGFGFSDQETVALLGAHTIGSLSSQNSGFDGPNGWVQSNTLLDNAYYREIVGSNDDNVETLIETAPPWRQVLEESSGKAVWEVFPAGGRILMLNADVSVAVGEGCYSRNYCGLLLVLHSIVFARFQISLVRELTDSNMDVNNAGVVNCGFTTSTTNEGETRCPHAERSLAIMAEYRFSTSLWLNDFQSVFKKMLTNGFDTTAGCNIGDVCSLPPVV
jgi:hypothetical protein